MKTLLQNKKAGFNYEILETFEAGMELFGFEVKALREKKGSLEGAHVTARGGEAYLLNAYIAPYQEKNTPDSYDPYRKRRLLLTKAEIEKVAQHESKKGLTIVPLSVYTKNSLLKLKMALVRGKKKYDKREDIKKRDMRRDVERSLKTKR